MTGMTGVPIIAGEHWYSGTGGTQIGLTYVMPGKTRNARVDIVVISHGGPYKVLDCYNSRRLTRRMQRRP